MRPISDAEGAAQHDLRRDGRTIAAAAQLALSGTDASVPALLETALERRDMRGPLLGVTHTILDRRFTSPSGAQRSSIADALTTPGNAIPERIRREVGAALRSW